MKDAINDYFKDELKQLGLKSIEEITEIRSTNIIRKNQEIGRKVDNLGKIQQSPGQYKNTEIRRMRGEDMFRDVAGIDRRK